MIWWYNLSDADDHLLELVYLDSWKWSYLKKHITWFNNKGDIL